MGLAELLDAIRREGDERAAARTAETDAEVARLESESSRRIAALRAEQDQACRLRCAESRRAVIAVAGTQARSIRLRAEQALSERLFRLARMLLPVLRARQYPELFALLAAEAGDGPWTTVSVNPADADLAAAAFPGVRIVHEAAITGGIHAESEELNLVVVNSLDRRLERAWPDMLPSIIREIREGKHETPAG